MNQETTLRAHLLNKFDQLPVPGQAAADWQKLEKALQVAMPLGLLAIALNWKLWLTKKFLWGWIVLIGGGGATALVIYDSARQADLAPSVNAAKQVSVSPQPDRKPSLPRATAALIAAADTNINQPGADTTRTLARKRKPLSQIARDTARTMRPRKSPPRIERDSTRVMLRSRKSPVVERDSARAIPRTRKSPPRIERDTIRRMSRPRKSIARIVRDSTRAMSRTRKSQPSIEQDTVIAMRRNRKPQPSIEQDTVIAMRRSRKSPPLVEQDTVMAMRRKSPPRMEKNATKKMLLRSRKPQPIVEQDTVIRKP